MGVPYDPHEIERHWQARWRDEPPAAVDVTRVDPARKLYNLVEFPYPSAAGLHIGHAMTYCGADTWGRYQQMNGRQVFQPIGFDSFGINAENYALQVGRHPRDVIAETVLTYRGQLQAIGAQWDWRHEVVTSDPSYYRWTQWVFLQLHRAGLAVRRNAPVVWCPACLTVLAREQVDGDACERCGTDVTERTMRQWFLRITAYADRLLDGLDDLDWPEPAKNRQRAWIGRGDDGSYRLHDWLISRQRYWGPPIPIIHCPRCGEVPVPEEDLPVLLPDVDDVRPTGTGQSPLAAAEEWRRVPCPRCGGEAERETDVSDTFFDSAWYFLRYPSSDLDDRPWDAERTARMLPVDQYAGGPEHVARHHLYARFVTMALFDLGLVPFEEPFPRIRLHGMLTLRGAKMSKSRGNVVNPDELIAAHGADVTRLALLFGRPWDEDGEFRGDATEGVERLLGRVWRLVTKTPLHAAPRSEPEVDHAIERVGADIDRMKCNTAIGELMQLVTWMERTRRDHRRTLVLLLAPLAPHMAEELWARLGETYSVHAARWPVAAPRAAGEVAATVEVVVQVDGRVRGHVVAPAGLASDEVRALAEANERVRAHLGGRAIERVVYVPDRLVNLVTVGG